MNAADNQDMPIEYEPQKQEDYEPFAWMGGAPLEPAELSLRAQLVYLYGMATSFNMLDPGTKYPERELVSAQDTGKIMAEHLLRLIQSLPKST